MSVRVAGLAVPFNVAMNETRKGWRMAFASSAFDSAVARFDTPLFLNHWKMRDISSSLRVHAAPAGLFFAGRIDDPHWAAAVSTAQQTGLLRGVSVSWKDDVGRRDAQTGVYLVESASLVEVSLMIGDLPAFPETWVRVT